MIFYAIIALILVSGLGIVLSRQILHSALFLLVSLLTVAAVFIIAGAEFLAATQIIIYVGGILILILFGIIVTNQEKVEKASIMAQAPALLISIGFAVLLYLAISEFDFAERISGIEQENYLYRDWNDSQKIGISLMTSHIAGLEFMALFLLITLVGAVILGGRKQK
jgi:NADH-quinone oxidoreductase subunit J